MAKLDSTPGRNPMRKGLQVLQIIAEAPSREWGVRELAQAVEMAPSTVQRLLRTLVHEGLAQQVPEKGRYQLGLEFLRLAYQVTANQPYPKVAQPVMRRLVASCHETALLSLYDPTRMQLMFVASVDSTHPLRYVVRLNEWLPVHASASGLAIMAFLSAEDRRRIVKQTRLKPFTERTVRDPQRLEAELASIRTRGYACTEGRRIPGAVGIAAPIRHPDVLVLGCLALTIPAQRFQPSREAVLGRAVLQHANQITEALGGRPLLHRTGHPPRAPRQPRPGHDGDQEMCSGALRDANLRGSS